MGQAASLEDMDRQHFMTEPFFRLIVARGRQLEENLASLDHVLQRCF